MTGKIPMSTRDLLPKRFPILNERALIHNIGLPLVSFPLQRVLLLKKEKIARKRQDVENLLARARPKKENM